MGKLIGVFATDIPSRVQGKVYDKLHEKLKTKGYNLVFFSAELERTYFNTTDMSAVELYAMAERMDFAAFFVYVQSIQNRDLVDMVIEMGKRKNIPIILFDCDICDYTPADGVITIKPDYKQGFEDCVRHLIEHHDCKDIFMLAGTVGNKYSEDRIDAYKKVMTEHGLVCTPDRIAYGGFWELPAVDAVNELIDRVEAGIIPVPQAICSANDSMAISTVKVLDERGYKVPEDILLTGFDGIEDGKFFCPAIATCEPVLDNLPDYIINVIENDIRGAEYMLPLRFIPKESCGCENSYVASDHKEMAQIMINSRQNNWQHSMLSNLSLSLLDSCDIHSLFGGMSNTVSRFRGLNLLYCIRDDLEAIDYYNCEYDRLRVRLNYDFYPEDKFVSFDIDEIIPDYEKVVLNAAPEDLFVFQLLHSASDRFGYSVIRAKSFVANDMRIFSQFAESFTNMLEGVLRNIRLEQANRKLNEMYVRMSEMYIRDVMTGLFNRTGYYAELDKYIAMEDVRNGYLHLISIDMDGLKFINDNFGHLEGDNAIKALAKAIEDCFAQPCISARFGGDEFMVALFTRSKTEPSQASLSERLNSYIKKLPILKDKEYSVGVSVGKAVVKVSEIETLREIEKIADDEMYINKRQRKGK